ncbi:hypothetical protein COBT_001716 [Conglomerata obtusa]
MQQTEQTVIDIDDLELLGDNKPIAEEAIEQDELNERIRDMIIIARNDIYEYYTGESKFKNKQLNEMFEAARRLDVSKEDIFDYKATIELMFNEIENDLERAMQDKGLQKYYKYQYNLGLDRSNAGLVNICKDFKSVTSEILFTIIYDNHKTVNSNPILHIIEIAKEYKDIITIFLYHFKKANMQK